MQANVQVNGVQIWMLPCAQPDLSPGRETFWNHGEIPASSYQHFAYSVANILTVHKAHSTVLDTFYVTDNEIIG